MFMCLRCRGFFLGAIVVVSGIAHPHETSIKRVKFMAEAVNMDSPKEVCVSDVPNTIYP